MKSQATPNVSAFEQALINTIRSLQPNRAEQVLDFARWLQTQPVVTDEEITEEELELEEEAWQMFKRYADKVFSYTDCTSFIVMRHRGIWDAFTNDHNFEQVGYQRLLR